MNEKVPDIIWIDEPDGVYYTEPLDGSVEYHRALFPAEVEAKAARIVDTLHNECLIAHWSTIKGETGVSFHDMGKVGDRIAAIIAAELSAAAEIRRETGEE